MYCETPEEQECFKRLKEHYPGQHDYMLDLIAWVFTNKPERFEEIIKEQRESGEEMMDLENFDIKSIMKVAPEDV